jgi:L-2-hydroxyglutarate oxidase LhgO
MSPSTDVVIIGAGVVGLAVGATVTKAGRSVFILEKNTNWGLETSSRHSGVIHAGIYYEPRSLKARLCVEGNRLLYEFCERYRIGHLKLGKIIVAVTVSEERELDRLRHNAESSGATGIRWLPQKDLRQLEPNVKALKGLLSETTGIIDSHELMRVLAGLALEGGTHVVYNTPVIGIEPTTLGYDVLIRDRQGVSIIDTRLVINCAGLHSDRVSAMAGIDLDAAGYRLHYCKGSYFSVGNAKNHLVSRLIFPVPEAQSAGLGIHVVFDLDHRMRLGPDSQYVPSIDYTVDAASRDAFYASAARFLPFLETGDLEPESAGIRPKLQQPGGPFRDFIIRDEADRGLPGLINLIGIESPGLTSSLAIGKYVARMVDALLP